jgi:hypothetical protein
MQKPPDSDVIEIGSPLSCPRSGPSKTGVNALMSRASTSFWR